MARYCLNIRDGDNLQLGEPDKFADLEAARREAMLSARRIIERLRLDARGIGRLSFEITDCGGKIHLIVPFSQAPADGRCQAHGWWPFRRQAGPNSVSHRTQ